MTDPATGKALVAKIASPHKSSAAGQTKNERKVLAAVARHASSRSLSLTGIDFPVASFTFDAKKFMDSPSSKVAGKERIKLHDDAKKSKKGYADLHFRSSNSPDRFKTYTALRRYFREVVEGLAVLHGAGYSHLDLKRDNIRMTEEGGALLSDLGECRKNDKPRPRMDLPNRGRKSPPERWINTHQNMTELTTFDVFQIGVIFADFIYYPCTLGADYPLYGRKPEGKEEVKHREKMIQYAEHGEKGEGERGEVGGTASGSVWVEGLD